MKDPVNIYKHSPIPSQIKKSDFYMFFNFVYYKYLEFRSYLTDSLVFYSSKFNENLDKCFCFELERELKNYSKSVIFNMQQSISLFPSLSRNCSDVLILCFDIIRQSEDDKNIDFDKIFIIFDTFYMKLCFYLENAMFSPYKHKNSFGKSS